VHIAAGKSVMSTATLNSFIGTLVSVGLKVLRWISVAA